MHPFPWRAGARAQALACLALSGALSCMTQAQAQSSYAANELLPATRGYLVTVEGFDATGRAVGLSNVNMGLKYDILVGFHIKYDYIDVEWPPSTAATRPVKFSPSTFQPERINSAGMSAGIDLTSTSPSRWTVIDRQGKVIQRLENAFRIADINERGWAVGIADLPSVGKVPALWRDGTMVRLPLGDHTEGEPVALNDAGQVVGRLERYEGRYPSSVPVRWSDGQIDWIGPRNAPPPPDTDPVFFSAVGTTAVGIANDGTVLFRVDEDNGTGQRASRTYLRRPDGTTFQPLAPEGHPLYLEEMNARGDAVGLKTGGGTQTPVIRKADGSLIDLVQWAKSGKVRLPSGAGTPTRCRALNNEGFVLCQTKAWGFFGSTYKEFRFSPQ